MTTNAIESESPANEVMQMEATVSLTSKKRRYLLYGACLICALVVPFVFEGFTIFQFTLAGIYAIAIIGLNLLTGFNGQFSLGHGTFFAIGAYTTAILVDTFEMSVYLTIPFAAVICLVVGFLFGRTVTRLAGIYLALATFALALATPQILKYDPLEKWTHGVQGINVFKPDVPSAIPLESDQWWYFFVMAFLLFFLWANKNLINSRSGRAMIAIRDNTIAARSMGINSALNKAVVFGISALCAGVAGALSAIVVEFVAPDSFTFLISFTFLTGMVIGGMGSIPGVLFGALYVLFLPNIAEDISTDLAYTISGVLLILTVYLMPSGAAGLFSTIFGKLKNVLNAKSRDR